MYKAIEPAEAHDLMQKGPITIVDIRDPASFEMGHLENAQQVTGDNIEEFIDSSDFNQPLLVTVITGFLASRPLTILASRVSKMSITWPVGLKLGVRTVSPLIRIDSIRKVLRWRSPACG